MQNGNLAGLIAIGLRLGAVTGIAGLGVVTLSEQVLALESWQFDTSKEQLVISLPKGVTPRYYLMAEPARIVLDLPNTEISTAAEQSYGGAVRQIRVAQFQPGLARIVMELSSEAVLAPGQVELQQMSGGDGTIQKWTLRPLLIGSAPASSGSATASVSPAATPNNPPITPAAQPAPVSTAVPTVPSPAATSALPPLEPGAIEIPVEMPGQSTAQPTAQSNPSDNTSRVAVTPVQPSALPVADSSPPIQVDFLTPLPATSAELATANGSATALSLPSGRALPSDREAASSQQIAPVRPMAPTASTGAGSFPIPTADGVSVPSLSTVTANAAPANAADAANKPTANRPTAHRSTVNRPTANPAQAPQPAANPAIPKAIQVIPFGQPLPL